MGALQLMTRSNKTFCRARDIANMSSVMDRVSGFYTIDMQILIVM